MIRPEILVALTPVYATPRVNEAIVLYKGAMSAGDEEQVQAVGEVGFEWQPIPHVRFELRHRNRPFLPSLGQCTLHLLDTNRILRADVTGTGWSSGTEPDLGRATGWIVSDESAKDEPTLQHVILHLPNFHKYAGAHLRNEQASAGRRARAVLSFEDWRVTLDSLQLERGFYDSLQSSGGYGFTHVGRLERADHASFSSSDAMNVLDILFDFFSFCRGAWCSPQLPIGFDDQERRVWEPWLARRTDRWNSVSTWFNDHACDGLEQLIPGFARRYRCERWGEPLRLANYWYVEANTGAGGVEGAIILVQAALELLGWTLLVEEKNALSGDGFQKLSAMDKIRLLLDACGIPLQLPPELGHLSAMAGECSFCDGPSAFTYIRNGLVHPTPKKLAKILTNRSEELIEASGLGLWYLELVLLRLCDFSGRYSCRLVTEGFKGQEVRLVPWAAPPPPRTAVHRT